LEFEHIITEKKSYKSISYFEKNGVEQILKDLKDFGWEVVTEKGKVLSAKKGRDNITLEPGGQFELSTDKSQDLVEIESCYLGFIKDMRQIMKRRDRISPGK
jgi:glutamate--cysteine ligase